MEAQGNEKVKKADRVRSIEERQLQPKNKRAA